MGRDGGATRGARSSCPTRRWRARRARTRPRRAASSTPRARASRRPSGSTRGAATSLELRRRRIRAGRGAPARWRSREGPGARDRASGSGRVRSPRGRGEAWHLSWSCDNFRVSSPILADKAFVRATITNFFFFFSLNCFILLPLYIEGIGGTEVEIGIVMGVYNAVGILCQPLVGPLVDAFGRRRFMLIGAGLVTLAALLATAAPSIPMLAFVRALQGVGFSAFFVANYSYVLDLTPPAHRGWALGIYGVAGLVATAVAPLIGEGMVRRMGFRPLFFLATAMAIVAAGYVWSLP